VTLQNDGCLNPLPEITPFSQKRPYRVPFKVRASGWQESTRNASEGIITHCCARWQGRRARQSSALHTPLDGVALVWYTRYPLSGDVAAHPLSVRVNQQSGWTLRRRRLRPRPEALKGKPPVLQRERLTTPGHRKVTNLKETTLPCSGDSTVGSSARWSRGELLGRALGDPAVPLVPTSPFLIQEIPR